MKQLTELRDSDIFPGAYDQDPSTFSRKETARAVLLNDLGQVALLSVGRYNYHKLPGGGIEAGEKPREALKRELLEEMGCKARILAEIGIVIEYKNEQKRIQTSYCYLGEQEGETVETNLTDSELAHNYRELWVNDIDSAIALIQSDQPIGYSRNFIRARELAFLRAAKNLTS